MKLDTEKVFSVFRLFYNENDAESFLPVAELSAAHTAGRILDGGDLCGDPRFYFLAAAETLCRVLEIKSARERLALTAAGALPAENDCLPRLKAAKALFSDYEALCAGLIRDDGFLFLRME